MLSLYPNSLDSDTNMPDRVPFVDLYEAAHINLVQDAIKAIETEIGTNPAGTMGDLKSRLAVSLNDDGTLKPHFPAKLITVGSSFCNFTSITAALNSITDASSSNRYIIFIYPGVYQEDVTLKQYVDIRGFNRPNVIIEGKVTCVPHFNISNLTIQKSLSNDYLLVMDNSFDIEFHNIKIYNDSGIGGAIINNGSGVGASFYDSLIWATDDDEEGYHAYKTSKTHANFYNCVLRNGAMPVIYFANGSYGQPKYINCRFEGGPSSFYWEASASPTPTVINCFSDAWDYVFNAAASKGSIATFITAQCPLANIFNNVSNYASSPILSSIYEE